MRERGRHIYYYCCCCCCCCCVFTALELPTTVELTMLSTIHRQSHTPHTRTLTHTQQEAHNERRRRHRTTFYRSFAAIKESNSEWESVLNLTQSLSHTRTHTRTHKQAYKYFMCKHCINISVCWYCFYCRSPTPSLTFSLPQLLLSKMSY